MGEAARPRRLCVSRTQAVAWPGLATTSSSPPTFSMLVTSRHRMVDIPDPAGPGARGGAGHGRCPVLASGVSPDSAAAVSSVGAVRSAGEVPGIPAAGPRDIKRGDNQSSIRGAGRTPWYQRGSQRSQSAQNTRNRMHDETDQCSEGHPHPGRRTLLRRVPIVSQPSGLPKWPSKDRQNRRKGRSVMSGRVCRSAATDTIANAVRIRRPILLKQRQATCMQ